MRVTIRVDTASATAIAFVLTALVIVGWKPSARSRSLSGISALSAPPARIEPAQATPLPMVARARLALPVRQEDVCGVGYRAFTVETACVTRISLAD